MPFTVDQVFVANPLTFWRGNTTSGDGGFAFQGPLTPVNIQGFPAPVLEPMLLAFPANQAPPNLNDLDNGATNVPVGVTGVLTCLNAYSNTAYRSAGAPAQPYALPGNPFDLDSGMQFALWDPIRGVRRSDIIRHKWVRSVRQTPYHPTVRDSWIFNCAYSNVNGNHNTFQGQTLTVRVDVSRDFRWRRKEPLFASVVVGGGPFNAANPVPATNQQIQRAHFRLLEMLLAADARTLPVSGNGYYFDAALSRTLSIATNYTQIVLVGNVKPVLQDRYHAFPPIKIDVALIEGFGTPLYEQPKSTPANYNVAAGNNQSYIAKYSQAQGGSGTFERVQWHEAQTIGQDGHTNHMHLPTPRRNGNPLVSALQGVAYDTLVIEYFNKVVLSGENHDKNLHKRLIIYYNRGIAPIQPLLEDAGGAGYVTNANPLPGLPPGPYTEGAVFDNVNFCFDLAAGAMPTGTVGAGNGALTVGPLNRDFTNVGIDASQALNIPVNFAQAGTAPVFADDNLNTAAGPNLSFIRNAMPGVMP